MRAAEWLTALLMCSCGGDPTSIGELESGITVSQVVTNAGCTTSAVAKLSAQLIAEQDCIHSGVLVDFSATAGVSIGAAVEPWLEPPAAKGLAAAAQEFGGTLQVDSAFRTLAQQYLLYEWYTKGLCGISLAAIPGSSNHETGTAVDLANYSAAKTAMSNHGWTWFGSADVVHFDYTAGGTIDLRPESVLAFQRLWNLNNPQDQITEDGVWGAMTSARLAMTSADGFAKGATCGAPVPDASTTQDMKSAPVDSAHVTPNDLANHIDATARHDAGAPSDLEPPGSTVDATTSTDATNSTPAPPSGCSCEVAARSQFDSTGILSVVLFGLIAIGRRRRATKYEP